MLFLSFMFFLLKCKLRASLINVLVLNFKKEKPAGEGGAIFHQKMEEFCRDPALMAMCQARNLQQPSPQMLTPMADIVHADVEAAVRTDGDDEQWENVARIVASTLIVDKFNDVAGVRERLTHEIATHALMAMLGVTMLIKDNPEEPDQARLRAWIRTNATRIAAEVRAAQADQLQAQRHAAPRG